jgi:uncharacterized protein YunC (DUF1805 family)
MSTETTISLASGQAVGHHIDLPGAPLLVAQAAKGFVMCGYLDVKVADKFGTAAAVVRGVKTIDALLAGSVTDVSAAAQALGVTTGMTGREALERFF